LSFDSGLASQVTCITSLRSFTILDLSILKYIDYDVSYDSSHDSAFLATMLVPDHVTGAYGIKNNDAFVIPVAYLPIQCATYIGLR